VLRLKNRSLWISVLYCIKCQLFKSYSDKSVVLHFWTTLTILKSDSYAREWLHCFTIRSAKWFIFSRINAIMILHYFFMATMKIIPWASEKFQSIISSWFVSGRVIAISTVRIFKRLFLADSLISARKSAVYLRAGLANACDNSSKIIYQRILCNLMCKIIVLSLDKWATAFRSTLVKLFERNYLQSLYIRCVKIPNLLDGRAPERP
jgi:hypothetical protein